MGNATSGQKELPTLGVEAVREWSQLVGNVLRGVAHALNNRAAALSAVLELANDPDDELPTTLGILSTEVEQVRTLTQVVRTIGAPRGSVEAFSPSDAVADVLAALRFHADLRERPISVDAMRAPPIRVARWMFVRAVLVLGVSAVEGLPESVPARIEMAEEGDWMIVRVAGNARGAATPCLRDLVLAMGGECLPDQPGFRVPTLAALRRREGR